MILKWGSFSHPLGQVGLSTNQTELVNEAGHAYADDINITIEGRLISQLPTAAACRADIASKQNALVAAYRNQNRDLVLYMPDGRTPSHHVYRASQMIGHQIRVVRPPSFPTATGAQGVTHLDFTIALQCERLRSNITPAAAIKSFSESLDFEPAGPRYGYMEVKHGLPQKQQLRAHTVFRVRQSGSAVGLFQRPPVPPPLWPWDLVQPIPRVHKGEPRRVGNQLIDWPISWSYDYESAFQMFGEPHLWGVTYGA